MRPITKVCNNETTSLYREVETKITPHQSNHCSANSILSYLRFFSSCDENHKINGEVKANAEDNDEARILIKKIAKDLIHRVQLQFNTLQQYDNNASLLHALCRVIALDIKSVFDRCKTLVQRLDKNNQSSQYVEIKSRALLHYFCRTQGTSPTNSNNKLDINSPQLKAIETSLIKELQLDLFDKVEDKIKSVGSLHLRTIAANFLKNWVGAFFQQTYTVQHEQIISTIEPSYRQAQENNIDITTPNNNHQPAFRKQYFQALDRLRRIHTHRQSPEPLPNTSSEQLTSISQLRAHRERSLSEFRPLSPLLQPTIPDGNFPEKPKYLMGRLCLILHCITGYLKPNLLQANNKINYTNALLQEALVLCHPQ